MSTDKCQILITPNNDDQINSLNKINKKSNNNYYNDNPIKQFNESNQINDNQINQHLNQQSNQQSNHQLNSNQNMNTSQISKENETPSKIKKTDSLSNSINKQFTNGHNNDSLSETSFSDDKSIDDKIDNGLNELFPNIIFNLKEVFRLSVKFTKGKFCFN